jgi:hypothetical protein
MVLGDPWRPVAPLPTGTVDAAERAAILGLYAGIAGGTPPGTTGAPLMLYHHHYGR